MTKKQHKNKSGDTFEWEETPWVSPCIDKYLENILITKEGDL